MQEASKGTVAPSSTPPTKRLPQPEPCCTSPCRDPTNGGWFTEIQAGGPTSTDKMAYEHAFVVLAAASATAAGRTGARALLDEALDLVLGRFWDEEYGMVVEQWDEGFLHLDGYRGVNANMHTVEALLSAFRPHGAAVGHWLEWARLALHLRAALGQRARDGCLTTHAPLSRRRSLRAGRSTEPKVSCSRSIGAAFLRERMHWVVAEATATAAALHKATGTSSYARWYWTWWEHIADCFVDHPLGRGATNCRHSTGRAA